jgi:hypothetical protein
MAKKISHRHACSDEELAFCKQIAGGLPAATAFGRVFLKERRKGNRVERYEPEDYEHLKRNPQADVTAVPAKEVSRRANLMLAQEHVKGYLAELTGSDPGDRAREVLTEQALFGDDTAARRAAEKILEGEDKMGMRDAYEQWAMVMCAIGAEVVVPIPGGGEAVADLREMFPRYSEALPPVDVIDKTIRSLEDYREAVLARGEE